MGKYTIHIDYETGDTNGRRDAERDLPYSWDNLDAAKETLKRIKEHYDWFECHRHGGYCWRHSGKNDKCAPQPKWHKRMTLPLYAHGSQREMFVEVVLDDGSKETMGAFDWCGYFESLLGAKIVEKNDESMGFTYR